MILYRFYFIYRRILMLFSSNIRVGKNVKVFQNSKIRTMKGNINIGDNCIFEKNTYISAVAGGDIVIHNNVYFNRNCTIVSRENVEIGENTIFGPGVYIYDHNHKFCREKIKNEFSKSEISIGSNCWIATGCIILKGTRIGNNCVIGAGVVISESIPDFSIVKRTQNSYVVEEIKETK